MVVKSLKKPSIKVLVAGNKFFSGNARRGYDYGWWNLFDALNRFENISTSFFDVATEAQMRGVPGMAERLQEIVSAEKPDLLWYEPLGSQGNIPPETLQSITDSTDTQTVLWINHPESQKEKSILWASCADYIVTISPETAGQYTAAGYGKKIIESQWGFNPFTYAGQPFTEIRDIGFCGTAKGNRSRILDKMKESGLSLDLFGAGWQNDSFLPLSDMLRIFRSSRINLHLGDAGWATAQPIRRRHFEVPGCGGFLLTTPAENLEAYYEPDKEIVTAASMEELIEKSQYYLAHESERKDIARRGWERTLADHTWTRRLTDIFGHLGFNASTPCSRIAKPASSPSGASTMAGNLFPADTEQQSDSPAVEDLFLVTVWVLAYNQLQYTKRCVESILHYTKGPYELLLIDHGSTDGTYDYFRWVKSFHPHTRVIKYFQNRIIEETCNHVFAVARGKYLAVATNDTVVHEGWLENFIQQIESAPDIAVVGPRSNNISGPQAAPADYKTLEEYQTFAAEWSKEHRGENFPIERMVGMCTLTRKEVYERIGGGDPDLPTNGRDGGYGFSDDDYSLRLRLGGYRSLVANDVFIHHYGSVTVTQHRPDLFGAPQNINKEKFYKKIENNRRIVRVTDGQLILKPYKLDDLIPIEERTIIRTPRICFAERGGDISITAGIESRYAAVPRKYNGQIVQAGDEAISSLVLKALEEKEYDFLVLLDSRLAPSQEIVSALAEYALCYPDVAVMVPVGNYAPSTHGHKGKSAGGVEIIPYADLSLCAINLKIVRPLLAGLARYENEEDRLWFLQRRIRGESYFVAKANDLEVNGKVPVLEHPYDTKPLPEQMVKEKKYAEAAAIYRNDLLKDPNFAEAYYQLASIAKKQQQKELALEQARQALQADPHHILSLVLLSRIFLERDDFKNAKAFVSQANFKQPGHPEVQKIVSMYEEKYKERPDVFQTDTSGETTSLTHCEIIKGKVSIILVTRNRLDCTKKCVNSIRRHTRQPYELIFVDNASKENTVKWLRRQVKVNKDCRLIENKENIGLIKGRNQGMNIAAGEYIVLLDNDVIVSQGWLDSMLQCLNSGSDVGIVGPMTNSGSGIQEVLDDSYRSVDYLDKYAAKFMERYRHRRIPCRNIAGFCQLFKHTLVEKIGLLDETFEDGHCEDEDYCLRAALEDCRNFIAGDVFVHHFGEEKSNGNRKTIGKKWELGLASPRGKKLAVVKAMELADDLYQKGKTDQAVETLINCIKLTPEAKEIYYELARIFIESRKYPEAWDVIGTIPEAAKDDLQSLEYAGYAKEGLGLDGEAAAYADRMLSLSKNHPAALNLKGVLAYKEGEKEKAADYFRKAINADPGYGEACTNLGVLCWSLDKKEEALVHLHTGFMLSPTLPDANTLYYSVISSLGMFSHAEDDFLEALHRHPHNKNLAFLYIDLLIQQGKLDEAMAKIEDSLALFGSDEGMLNAAMAVREKIGPRQVGNAKRKSTLSLCMIVKNEEKYLAKCLKSVRDVVDEMIVVDTGSTDKTADIGRVFGAKIFDFPWTGDFSAARNFSLAQATGDWILVLDADEVISSRDFAELETLIQRSSSSPAAYLIMTRNYLDNSGIIGWTQNVGQYPEEAGGGWIASAKVRLFKRRGDIVFSNPVHELVEDSLQKAGIPILKSHIIVHHYGKLDTERDVLKSQAYYLLGKMKYDSDPKNMKYIYELAKQAQELRKYEEAVQLWLELLSLLRENPESPGYKTIAAISYGDPLPEIYIQLASAYVMLDRFEEALEAARKAMGDARGKLPAYVHVYAYCEIIAGSLEMASSALDELLPSMPDYPPAVSLMAVSCCLKGKNERAKELFQRLRLKGIPISSPLKKVSEKLSAYGKKDEAALILKLVSEI
ncbi:MAG: SPBc2 prophage-derived glycosyltransferase SunS [Syntrophus sp. PtaU1.Bin208]|nr:MAG: SPBc2 prophage-derived glycosyltransferase SunS [Syntrophus sp. PtaU1.Bin208]